MKAMLPKILLIGSLLANFLLVMGFQTVSDPARKIDSFGAVDCDDAMARLDYFAAELARDLEAFLHKVRNPAHGSGRIRSSPFYNCIS